VDSGHCRNQAGQTTPTTGAGCRPAQGRSPGLPAGGYTPTVNDWRPSADAMRRPLTGSAPPKHICTSGATLAGTCVPAPERTSASSHAQMTSRTGEIYLDFLRELRKASPAPSSLLSPRPADPGAVSAIGQWVRESGWIEVGRRRKRVRGPCAGEPGRSSRTTAVDAGEALSLWRRWPGGSATGKRHSVILAHSKKTQRGPVTMLSKHAAV